MKISIFQPSFWINFWNRISANALDSILQIIGVILLYLIAKLIFFRVIDGALSTFLSRDSRINLSEHRLKRLQTLQNLIKNILGYLLFFIFSILLLRAVGLDILPVITTASVLGVAVALGSQKLFKDVISGFFLIVDDLYAVGDVVTIGTSTGRVEEIGMRVTRLRDQTGKEHMLANGDIGTVINLSRFQVEDYVEISVAHSADPDKSLKILNEAGKAYFEGTEHELSEAPHVVGVSAFTKDLTTYRMSIKTDPLKIEPEKVKLRVNLREALAKAEIPFG